MTDYTRDPDYHEAKKLLVNREIANCIEVVRLRRDRRDLMADHRNVRIERVWTVVAIVLAFVFGLVLGR